MRCARAGSVVADLSRERAVRHPMVTGPMVTEKARSSIAVLTKHLENNGPFLGPKIGTDIPSVTGLRPLHQ